MRSPKKRRWKQLEMFEPNLPLPVLPTKLVVDEVDLLVEHEATCPDCVHSWCHVAQGFIDDRIKSAKRAASRKAR